MPSDVVILPRQAERIAIETSKTGAAIGVSQSVGNTLTLNTGKYTFDINSAGDTIATPSQESLL